VRGQVGLALQKRPQRMGGGFASALALAYFRADSDNQARILGAFPDLFEKYRRIARELAETTET
jgi:2-oxo-4-hydroxy-4-carboxy--5-ureidoimidazoline (OHCU) decarboxylase